MRIISYVLIVPFLFSFTYGQVRFFWGNSRPKRQASIIHTPILIPLSNPFTAISQSVTQGLKTFNNLIQPNLDKVNNRILPHLMNFQNLNSDLLNLRPVPVVSDSIKNDSVTESSISETKDVTSPPLLSVGKSQQFGPGKYPYDSPLDKLLGSALYAVGTRILGPDITDSIAPFAPNFVPSIKEIQEQLPPFQIKAGRIVLYESGKPDDNRLESNVEKPRTCVTADGGEGHCIDLNKCPSLILDLGRLRRSLCFKSLFVPGVCCPIHTSRPDDSFTTRRPSLTLITRPPVTTTPPLPSLPALATTETPGIANVSLSTTVESNTDQCGIPQVPTFRIVGGHDSIPGQWPWTVAIFLHGSFKNEFWCAGSIISEQYVLTAAHCTKDSRQNEFSPSQFTVKVGAYNIKTDEGADGSETVDYGVEEIIVNPEFRPQGFYNDLALFKLDRPVKFNELVLPICLPDTPSTREDDYVGETATVVGWGATSYNGRGSNTLKEVQVPIWQNSDCDRVYFQPIEDNFLCAGLKKGGKDACQGDSGGPMMIYKDGRWRLIGVVSFGNRCAELGYPGVYTRITHFLNWIKRNTL